MNPETSERARVQACKIQRIGVSHACPTENIIFNGNTSYEDELVIPEVTDCFGPRVCR